MEQILQWFSNNYYVTALCSVCTIIGFLITLYVTFKTRRIQKVLTEYKRIEKFNKYSSKVATSLKIYQTSLLEDEVPFRKIQIDILNDLRTAKKRFIDVLSKREKKEIHNCITQISKGTQGDINAICNELSKMIAIFEVKKES